MILLRTQAHFFFLPLSFSSLPNLQFQGHSMAQTAVTALVMMDETSSKLDVTLGR